VSPGPRDRDTDPDTPDAPSAPPSELESPMSPTSSDPTAAEAVRIVEAARLLGERGILRIEHRGELYTLRITRNDRLILTK